MEDVVNTDTVNTILASYAIVFFYFTTNALLIALNTHYEILTNITAGLSACSNIDE